MRVPDRIFDLLTEYVAKNNQKDFLFAERKKEGWVKYSGKEILKLTNSVSKGLLRLGIEKGDRIVIIANNCPQWNVLDFAIQQIGAIVVPVFPNISIVDFRYIIKHSDPKIIFVGGIAIYNKYKSVLDTDFGLNSIFSVNLINGVLSIDDLIKEKENSSQYDECLCKVKDSINADDIATIIYTSGTSGKPKGVMISHKNILSNIAFYSIHYPATETAISYLPLSHVFERSAQYTRIFFGESTYYVENPGTILRDIQDVKPGHFSTIPRVVEKLYYSIVQNVEKLPNIKRKMFLWAISLAENYDETKKEQGFLIPIKLFIADKLVYCKIRSLLGGNMQFIISGGASIQPRLVKFFAAIRIPIVEGYGMTEASPVISTNSLVYNKMKSGTVGIPCSNLDIKIDKDTNEILVRGSSIMLGYYKDDDLTRKAFDVDGYFHTGDKGKFDKDGFLVITGRIKEMFKTSMGKYICPSLIENKFLESMWFDGIIVLGEYQKFAAALIVPSFVQMRKFCCEKGIPYTSNSEMIKNDSIIMRFRQEVDLYNKSFGETEKIRRFVLLDHEWSVENGELTPSLKMRREVIQEKYKYQIQELFS